MESGAKPNKINDPPKLYWIHCYKCFELYVEMRKKRRCFLCACQHLVCENCIRRSPEKSGCVICPECHKTVPCKEIGNNLAPHIKDLFHPEPWKDGLNTRKIVLFQKRHIDHYMKEMEKIPLKLAAEKSRLDSLRKETRKLFLQREELIKISRKNREKIRQIMAEKADREKAERNVGLGNDSGIDSESRIGQQHSTHSDENDGASINIFREHENTFFDL